jgi:hypothetical protein
VRMTRVWLIVLILLGTVGSAVPSTKRTCVEKAKEGTRTIRSLSAPGKAADAKALLEQVVTALRDCGFTASELADLVSFQKKVNAEVDRLAKAGKPPRVAWYALEFIKRLDALPVGSPEAAAKPTDKAVSAPEAKASDLATAGPAVSEDLPAPAPAKKIESRFPIDDFVGDGKSRENAGISVVEFEELRVRAEVMAKSIENLTREVRSSRVAVWTSLASLAVSLAALAVGVFLLAVRRRRPAPFGGGQGRSGR